MIGTRRRWWYAALLTLLAVVSLVLVASWAIVRIYGPAFTGERIEALLSEALGQPVRVRAVQLTPWRGRASLVDLEVGARPTPPGGVGLRAAAIDVSIDIASLWRRQLTVSALVTDLRLDATVPATAGGGPDLFPLPQSFAVGPLHVGIGRVRVKGGTLLIRVPETPLTVEIAGPDVTAQPAAGDLDVSGRLDMLRLDALGRREQLDQVALDGRVAADLIRIRQIGARWHGEALQLDGEVRHPWVERREVSLRLRGEVALAALAQTAGTDPRIDGTAQVAIEGQWADRTLRLDDIQVRLGAGRVRGRAEAAPLGGGGTSLSLDLREVVLPGSLAGLGVGTVTAQGRVRDGGIDLTRAQAAWRGLTASLTGRIASGAPLAMHATAAGDLGEISRALALGALGGRATVSADLTGRGQTPAIEGRAEIVDLVVAGQAVEPVEASFRLAATPGPETRWEGTVQLPRVRSGQIVVEQVTAPLAVDGQRLTLTRARARAAGAPVEASGEWEWAGSGRGHAEVGPVSLGALAGVPSSLRLAGSGRATVDASVDGSGATASARATLDQVSAVGLALGTGRAEVRLRGPALDAALTFPARRLRAQATGRLESGGALATTLELDELALEPVLRELGSAAADHVEGRVSSRGEASIPVSQPASGRGVIRVTPDGLRVLGAPWTARGPLVLRWEGPRIVVEHVQLEGPAGRLSASGTLIGPERRGLAVVLDNAQLPGALAQIGRGAARVDVRLGGGDVELTRLDAQWPGLVAAGSGHVHADGALALTGRVETDLARLGPALGVSGLGGRATLTADARGRSDAIEATGVIRAPQIQVRGATVSDVELPLRWARSSLRLDNGQARIGTSRIAADAGATWTGRGPLTADALARDTQLRAEIRAPAARLEDLSPLLPAAAQGRGELALAARAEGTPRAWRGSGTLTSPLAELGAGPLRQLRAVFALDATRIDVTELSVDALGVPTRATATWAWAGGGSAKATLGPAPLAGLAGGGLRGTARATMEAAMSSASDVTGTARATLDDVAVGAVTLGRGQLDVSARDGAVRADLAFPDPGLRVSGRGRIDAAGTLDAEAAVPEVDLARLTRALGPALSTLGGKLAARATARVPLAEPRRGEGVLSLDPVRLVVAGDAWESPAPIQVRWTQGVFSLAEFRLAAKKDGFVSGAGTLSADGKLEGRASAQVPLSTLGAMRPEIQEIGGVLDLSLRASGSVAAPALAGDGAIRRGTLLLRDRPETMRDIEARFTLSSQGVQVRDATASLGGGRLTARGDVALEGWLPGAYRFKLQAQDVSVGQIEGFSSAWDADLELSGITREAQLTGRARLVRGAYRRDLSIISLVLSPEQAAVAQTGTPLRLRVRVDLDNNLVVRSRTADLRAGGVLTVEGTTARPVIFGAVESRDGRIAFRGRDWSVTSAVVRFADPRRLDPFLDVLATSRIAEYDVTMQVTGPVSNITVRFSSTPRLSQNDLLSLVAFGATSTALRDSPATVLLGEAGKMLAQNVLGVDPTVSGLRVSTGSANDGASEMHGFPGEERTPIGPTRNSASARKDTVHVEYQLWSPLYLSGEYDRDYGYGADVVLRFRFR